MHENHVIAFLELAGPADGQYKENAMETLEYLSRIQAAETITSSDEEGKENSARLEND